MNHHANLLLEIGCAELPARSQFPLIQHMSELFAAKLATLSLAHDDIHAWVSPRRLAIRIDNVQTMQVDKTLTRKGPALAAAYDKEGNPSPALSGFMKANHLQLADLQTEQGYVVAQIHEPGKPLTELLPSLVTDVVKALAIPKPMRWGDHDFTFLRPISWLVLLLDETVVNLSLFGIASDRISYGHRFHHPEAIHIESPLSYEKQLEQACVAVNQHKRRQCILHGIEAHAKSLDATAIVPEPLLDEVVGLVEWPKALLCPFNENFLTVPKEALILAMQQHQKSFALTKEDKLLPYFVTIANIESHDETRVIAGNAKVMHARLADAAFFYEHDKKTRLEDFAKALAHVTFQDKLGSLQDKTERVKKLALDIAKALKNQEAQLSLDKLEHTASIYKADLMSRMVGEFPELQGIMGYYYALAEGLDTDIAQALRDYYHPRFAEDSLPVTTMGQVLALAERIDTLVSIFTIGHRPTGDKDPYGLRRAALGIVRILIEKQLNIDLFALIQQSIHLLNQQKNLDINQSIATDILTFIYERFKAYGLSQMLLSDSCKAVESSENAGFIYDKHLRWQALEAFREKSECARLAEANKRVNNILNKATATHSNGKHTVQTSLFQQDEEKQLDTLLIQIHETVTKYTDEADYIKALMSLMPLCDPIDHFFDKVMVNVEDENTRNNRLALLQALRRTLQHVADLSQLQL